MPARCLFIGLGGIGCRTLVQLYTTMKNDLDSARKVTEHEWLAIDSDSESLDAITSGENGAECLPGGIATQVQLFKPQEYRAAHPQLFRGISRRWLYNIPRSLKTEGVRPLGTLAFLDHYEQLSRTLQSKLAQLIKGSSDDPYRSSEPLRIYVIGSAHGGTGGGMLTEVGYMVRDIMSLLNWRNYRLCGNLSVATTLSANHSEMASAAAVACCTELVHCMDAESMIPPIHYANASINNPQRPFDWVNLFDGGLYGSSSEEHSLLASLAEAIWIDSQTMVSSVLSGPRVSPSEKKIGWLRTVRTTKLRTSTPINGTSLSRLCCAESVRKALSYLLGPQALTDGRAVAPRTSQCNATCTGDMPLTSKAAEDIVRRVLVQLNLQYNENTTEEQLLGTWVRRLSDYDREVEAQFAEDLKVLQAWLGGMIQARVLNWRQLEKLQLVLIERVMDLSNVDQSELILYLAQFDFPGTRAELVSRVSNYLVRFSRECLSLLQRLQKRGRELGKRLKSWNESLLAENSLATGQELPKYEMLDGEWAQVGARVVAVLESTFARLTLQLFDGALNEHESADEADAINLPHLLTLSRDLCERFAKDFGIVLDQTEAEVSNEEDICLKEIGEYLPSLSQCGGDVYRLLVVPQDQVQSVSEAVHRFGLTETTTLLPSAMSRKAFVFTDAANLNLSQLVGTLWRPSHKTFQLAERLLTRVDVEWPSVGNLLILNSAPIEAITASQPPLSDSSQLNTQQVNVAF